MLGVCDDDCGVLICEQRLLMSRACLHEALLRCQGWPSLPTDATDEENMLRNMLELIKNY